jgi:hypothetical protein
MYTWTGISFPTHPALANRCVCAANYYRAGNDSSAPCAACGDGLSSAAGDEACTCASGTWSKADNKCLCNDGYYWCAGRSQRAARAGGEGTARAAAQTAPHFTPRRSAPASGGRAAARGAATAGGPALSPRPPNLTLLPPPRDTFGKTCEPCPTGTTGAGSGTNACDCGGGGVWSMSFAECTCPAGTFVTGLGCTACGGGATNAGVNLDVCYCSGGTFW